MTVAGRTVAVIGGNGQLGSDIVAECTRRGYVVRSLTHGDLRVEDPSSVMAAMRELKPAVIVNTAAFHVVPKCEELPDEAYRVNALGALNLAKAANSVGATNVYFSTDYVFDGVQRTPYKEADKTNPLNVYGVTKLAGEQFTMNYSDHPIVVRVSGIYGRIPSRSKGGNFVTNMIRAASSKPEVRVVNDEVLTPTPTTVIAAGIASLLDRGANGLFHMTCEGACSWFEFAQAIFAELGLSTPLFSASVADFPSTVRRPHYSVLDNARLREFGQPVLPHWRDALVEFLRDKPYG